MTETNAEAASVPSADSAQVSAPGQSVVILDFGSQYTQLIARRVRELGVYSHVLPWHSDKQRVLALSPRALILSGGPETVTASQAPQLPEWLPATRLPVLGICYGMQALVQHFGGRVQVSDHREFGPATVRQTATSPLFDGLADDSDLLVWASHGDRVEQLPEGFRCIAASDNAPIAAMQSETLPWFGLQFHPEVTHTPSGGEILRRFLFDVADCQKNWQLKEQLARRVAAVQAQVGDEKVLLGISGGVDSAVAAALLSRAIGDQLVCVLVDNGLMRKGEIKQVTGVLAKLNINLEIVDASKMFLRHLSKVEDPERKRRVIGATFIDVFEHQASKLGNIRWLAQGTIYSDVIESSRTPSDATHVIKSHHNVGGLPERMNMELVEPLRDMFKDEVCKLGKELGLPEELLSRHPFPGPGLAVRMLGPVCREGLDTLREADAIFLDELRQTGYYDKVSQAFAVLLPVMSVGVTGDSRRYAPVLALRAVETVDFMTAHWARLPWDLLDRTARRILNSQEGISRVVYDVSGKPPATIEWE